MRKRREILTSPSGPGNADTESGVSPVRGADPTVPVTDLPRVSGLSGVRSDNPDGKTQEVSPVLKKVAKPELESVPTSLDEKLEFLNSLRLIRKHPPKVKDPKYQDLIQMLYHEWIDGQMLQILNPTLSPHGFTEEEESALRVLAQTILQRQQKPNAQPKAATPMIPRTGNSPKPIGGLDPGVDSVKLKQAQMAFLNELQKMEREGPDF